MSPKEGTNCRLPGDSLCFIRQVGLMSGMDLHRGLEQLIQGIDPLYQLERDGHQEELL